MPAASSRRGRGAGLALRRTCSGPRDVVVPGGSLRCRSWAACAAVVSVCGPGRSRVRFFVPYVVRQGNPPVHRGGFVWTLTPPLWGRRTPRPAPVRGCMCVLFLAGSAGPDSWARFGAPHPSFVLLFCSAPLRAGVAPSLSFGLPSFFSLCAPAVSYFPWLPAPRVLGLGPLWLPPAPSRSLFFF